jgi:hypothetical protein
LNANIVETYIDDMLLARHPWKSNGGSASSIAAVDLFATPNGPFYQGVAFDDLCIVPDKPTILRRGIIDNFSTTFPSNSAWESSFRGPELQSAYPGSPWKSFDDPTPDRHFGLTWQLPDCHILRGQFRSKFRASAGGSANDFLYLGLNPPALRPPTWAWGQQFALLPGAGGSWNVGDPARIFSFDLGSMPVGSYTPAGLSLMAMINDRSTYSGRFDMLFQDDSQIDYAQLALWTCCPNTFGFNAEARGRAALESTPHGNLKVTTAAAGSGASFILGDATSGSIVLAGSAAYNMDGVKTSFHTKDAAGNEGTITQIGHPTQTRFEYDFSQLGATSVTFRRLGANGSVLSTHTGPASGSYLPIPVIPPCDGDILYSHWFDPITQQWVLERRCIPHPEEAVMVTFPGETSQPDSGFTQRAITTVGLSEFEIAGVSAGTCGRSSQRTGAELATGLGGAILSPYAGGLIVSEVGSSGNDGVRLDTGNAAELSYTVEAVGGESDTLPAGSEIEVRTLGIRGGASYQLLSTVRYPNLGDGSYEIIPDFSPVGATQVQVRFYRDGDLLRTENRPNNQRVAICIGKGDKNSDEKDKVGKPTKRLRFHQDTQVITQAGPLLVDAIEIEADVPPLSISGGLQAVELRGVDISEFTIDETSARRLVRGRVILGDFGQPTGQVVSVEVRVPGSITPLEVHNVTLGEDADCEFATAVVGPIDLAIKGPHWLRKTFATAVSRNGLSSWAVTLKNGDVNDDNEVGIGDFALLSMHFGGTGPLGDLNGDDEVDIGDFAILSSNFGEEGDS